MNSTMFSFVLFNLCAITKARLEEEKRTKRKEETKQKQNQNGIMGEKKKK